MRAIEPDFKVWEGPDLLAYIRVLQPETVKLDSMIARLRDYIFTKAINIDDLFTKKISLKIKTKEGTQDCEVVKVEELMKFMDQE
jgi:hypothetical protein